jgi:hypothetical protein
MPAQEVRKTFVPMIDFLNANANKRVSTLLPTLLEMASSRTAQNDHVFYDAITGEVYAVLCYYHQKYEIVGTEKGQADYGNKAGSVTGLNNQCKEGTNAYSKRNREYKAANTELMNQLLSGKLTGEEGPAQKAAIDAAFLVVIPREDKVGFASKDELHAGAGKELTTVKPVIVAK